MTKNSRFVTIQVNKRKYKLITNDLKRVYKLEKTICPSIPFYNMSNLKDFVDKD